MLLNILVGSYLILVIMDSATTYIGIKNFGLVETLRSNVLFDYYGLSLGMIVSTAFCLSMGWLLWRIRRFRRFKVAAFAGLSALATAELAAVVNNVIQILGTQ